MALIKCSPGQKWPGFSFALHLLRVQGFSFAMKRMSHTQTFTAAFCRPCIYTAQTPKPFTGLYSGVSVNLTHSNARNTAGTQAAYTSTATRWKAYRQALHLHRYQIPAPRRTPHSSAQPPIIIRYIRVQGCAPVMDLCQTVQHIADHASPAACNLALGQQSGRTLHPAGQSSGRGVAGGGGTTGGLSPHLFSGFRPIANRGQQ